MAIQPNRDAALMWRRSSASGGDGACVEVAKSDSSVLVRDSRNRSEPVIAFTESQWRRFIGRIKSDELGLR